MPTWSQRVAPVAEQPWRWCPVSARLRSVRVCCGTRPGLRGPLSFWLRAALAWIGWLSVRGDLSCVRPHDNILGGAVGSNEVLVRIDVPLQWAEVIMNAPAWLLGDGASQPRHVLRGQDLAALLAKPGSEVLARGWGGVRSRVSAADDGRQRHTC